MNTPTIRRTTALVSLALIASFALALGVSTASFSAPRDDTSAHASLKSQAQEPVRRRVGSPITFKGLQPPGRVLSGSTLTFAGKTVRALKGKRVKLERRIGRKGKWVTVAQTRVAGNLRYRVSGKTARSGPETFRAVVKTKKKTFRSRLRGYNVYQWFYVSDLPLARVAQGEWSAGPMTIGGVSYPHSVHGFGTNLGTIDWGDYLINQKCVSLSASIGLDDSSGSGARGEIVVGLNNESTSLGEVGRGAARPVTVDITNQVSLRLEVRLASDGRTVVPGFGNARVLCFGRP